MMTRLTLLMLLLVLAVPAYAQLRPLNPNEGKEGEVTAQPICSTLVNRSDQTIMGTLATASQKITSGDTVKHRDNFRLAAGEKKEFCTTGPFYAGRRLELVIRTLIPLFECKTKIDKPIYLDAVERPGGFRKLSATCE